MGMKEVNMPSALNDLIESGKFEEGPMLETFTNTQIEALFEESALNGHSENHLWWPNESEHVCEMAEFLSIPEEERAEIFHILSHFYDRLRRAVTDLLANKQNLVYCESNTLDRCYDQARMVCDGDPYLQDAPDIRVGPAKSYQSMHSRPIHFPRHEHLATEGIFPCSSGHSGGRVRLKEWYEGADSLDWIKTQLDEEVYLDLLAQAMIGCGYAHEQGWVHRDFKPGNIWVIGDKAKLGDHDAAIPKGAPMETYTCGTDRYVDLVWYEYPLDVHDPSTDVFAAGISLLEFYVNPLKIGPFVNDLRDSLPSQPTAIQIEQALQHLQEVKSDYFKSSLPAKTCSLVASMLTYDRSERPTMEEGAAILRRAS
ncbi:hypothetical protein HOM98_05140 [Candidatus Peregrinibacteria bacterium]|jgi:hypothetical protein|nr:hypothetical protein [Candidatus Peregrinibacteria bacterium]MBT7483849.1 hypothetical protein [Candidatus Peregrinibacteria bacterium]